jgi:hypothetical protein
LILAEKDLSKKGFHGTPNMATRDADNESEVKVEDVMERNPPLENDAHSKEYPKLIKEREAVKTRELLISR